MKALAVEADLNLDIDGQPARLTGSGRHLTLHLSSPVILRDLLKVSLPNVKRASDKLKTFSGVPQLLKNAGLTVTVEDDKGDLLVLGEGAEGNSYTLPILGKVEDVKLANARAAVRLVFDR